MKGDIMVWTENPTEFLTIVLNTLYLLSRYVHVVSAMLLVGGLLFYEMVVPAAIAELPEATQLAVFARARWVFRWIIWMSVSAMILTGAFMTYWRMQNYIQNEFLPQPVGFVYRESIPWPLRTGWWWAAHVLSAGIAILLALHLVAGDRPPAHPVNWLRLDLMLLLIVIFFATVTRQVDQIHHQRAMNLLGAPIYRIYRTPEPDEPPSPPATAPTTEPSS